MTVSDWHKTEIMQTVRQDIRGTMPLSACAGCYHEEHNGYESRRIKENFKSVIFTEQAFERSYQQSPMHTVFENNQYQGNPVDWHVDLGNECNLACKMCVPQYSSKVSQQYRKWNLIDTSKNSNWTLDPEAWQNFLNSIDATVKLNRLHFMGGEPLLNKRFPELLDYLIKQQRTNISISFVTNGTILNQDIVDRLKQFASCDIEVSMESISSNNEYIRQGIDNATVLANVNYLLQQQSDKFHMVLRSVPQLLSINNYDQYIVWAWEQGLPIQGVPLTYPDYLQISVLPFDLRQSLIPKYQAVLDKIGKPLVEKLATGRNPSTVQQTLTRECRAMINMLNAAEPNNVAELKQQLSTWLQRWDREYGLNAHDYYPEYREFLDAIQYRV